VPSPFLWGGETQVHELLCLILHFLSATVTPFAPIMAAKWDGKEAIMMTPYVLTRLCGGGSNGRGNKVSEITTSEDISLLYTSDGVCDRLCLVFVCRGRYGLGGVFLLFILGPNLGEGGPVRGLRVGRRRGWCEEWARSG
jgi:hypothetical protein